MTRAPSWLPLAVLAAGALAFVVPEPCVLRDFPLDDAWIHRVYARAFAFGGGFAYNDGAQEAGATSPLWIVLSAPAHWLGVLADPAAVVWGVKALGVGLAAAAVELTRRLARAVGGGATAGALAGCLLALEPRLLFSALSGMEVALLVALWLGAAWALVAGRTAASAVLLGLAPVARPEAAVLWGAGVLLLAVRPGPRDPLWRRPGTWIALLGPAAAWSLFCRAVNGHWLPNTYYVKAGAPQLGAEPLGVALSAVTGHGWASTPAFAAGLLGLVAWLASRRGWREVVVAVVLLLAPALYAAAVGATVHLRLDGYYWLRYVDPAALVGTAAAALGVGLWSARGLAMLRSRSGGRRTGTGEAVAAAAVALALLASLPRLVVAFAERRERLASDGRAIHAINVAAGRWIHDHTPADAVVGVNDAGALRYFGGRETVDLAGLNDADVAFGRVDPARLVGRLDYVAVFPSWFRGSGLLRRFEPLETFSVPPGRYTVCDCPGQTAKVVARRRSTRGRPGGS